MNILHSVTLKNLKQNRVRTLVTLIGIILSVSLFTAVTTSVTSLTGYLVRVIENRTGSWHGALTGISGAELKELAAQEEVADSAALQQIGFAHLPDSSNPNKPYLYVAGIGEGLQDILPVHLTRGRMPVSGREILLPDHLLANGGVTYQINEKLTLDLGDRLIQGEAADQSVEFQSGAEEIRVRTTRDYEVVGFYERAAFEAYESPGYTALTLSDGTGPDRYDAYLKVSQMKGIYRFFEENYPDSRITLNSDLLRFTGNSNEGSLNGVLYGMAGVLSLIILFGSVSLIYNAFAISISERTRQFGLLKSMGATRRQLRRSVLFEGAALSVIGIPLGILLGLAGIGITLAFAGGLLSRFQGFGGSGVRMTLVASPWAILLAALLGFFTVLLSAWIPSKRASAVSPMEAIRMSSDVKIEAGRVKTHALTGRLFGFEGTLAAKNFRRNKRRYRSTVISLFMSVVLFISAASFTAYLKGSTSIVMPDSGYDIRYAYLDEEKQPPDQVAGLIGRIPGVEKIAYIRSLEYQTLIVPKGITDPSYKAYIQSRGNAPGIEGVKVTGEMLHMNMIFLDDAAFLELLNENGLSQADYLSGEPKGLVYDHVKIFDPSQKKYYPFTLLTRDEITATHLKVEKAYGEAFFSGVSENGSYLYQADDPQGEEQMVPVAPSEVETRNSLSLGARIKDLPMVEVNDTGDEVKVIYPLSRIKDVLGDIKDEELEAVRYYIKAPAHQAVFEQMGTTLRDASLPTAALFDQAADQEMMRALILIVSIFSYGFIILISLIAAANVFNTIHTNIGLRRREFAMLRSIGMTKKGFRRMMAFECLLYGSKSLLYGLPVALGVTWLIYQAMQSGLEIGFFIPWASIPVAVGSVFLVVVSSTVYAMKKISEGSTVEALKNENL